MGVGSIRGSRLHPRTDRFQQKVELRADLLITQPVFDPDALLRFLDEVEKHEIPIMAGIWPLASAIATPCSAERGAGRGDSRGGLAADGSDGTREEQMQVGIEIARQGAAGPLHDRVAGIQVSAPFGRIETALAVIEGWEVE